MKNFPMDSVLTDYSAKNCPCHVLSVGIFIKIYPELLCTSERHCQKGKVGNNNFHCWFTNVQGISCVLQRWVCVISRNSTIHFVSLTLHLYELTIIKIQSNIIEYFGLEGRSCSSSFCSKQGHHSGQITHFRAFSNLVFKISEDVDYKNLTVQPVSMQFYLNW